MDRLQINIPDNFKHKVNIKFPRLNSVGEVSEYNSFSFNSYRKNLDNIESVVTKIYELFLKIKEYLPEDLLEKVCVEPRAMISSNLPSNIWTVKMIFKDGIGELTTLDNHPTIMSVYDDYISQINKKELFNIINESKNISQILFEIQEIQSVISFNYYIFNQPTELEIFSSVMFDNIPVKLIKRKQYYIGETINHSVGLWTLVEILEDISFYRIIFENEYKEKVSYNVMTKKNKRGSLEQNIFELDKHTIIEDNKIMFIKKMLDLIAEDYSISPNNDLLLIPDKLFRLNES